MTFAPLRFDRFYFPVALWAIFTLAATALGPFGTMYLLATVPRFFYWAFVVAVSIGFDFAIRHYWLVSSIAGYLLRRAVFVLILGVFIFSVNAVAFATWGGTSTLPVAIGYVLVVSLCIEAAVALIMMHLGKNSPADTDPEQANELHDLTQSGVEAILQKLPEEKRGDLLRLEAQGHYLRVVTSLGEELILMRLKDALALLPPGLGLQVHRSHWVASSAVLQVKQVAKKLVVSCEGGINIPVSRARQAEVESHFSEKLD